MDSRVIRAHEGEDTRSHGVGVPGRQENHRRHPARDPLSRTHSRSFSSGGSNALEPQSLTRCEDRLQQRVCCATARRSSAGQHLFTLVGGLLRSLDPVTFGPEECSCFLTLVSICYELIAVSRPCMREAGDWFM